MKTYKKYKSKFFSANNLFRKIFLQKNFLLKKYWEQVLSTYQLSTKKMPSKVSFLSFVTLGDFERQRNHRCLTLSGWKEKAQLFIKKNIFQYNYLMLAKLVDILGNTQFVKSRIWEFIKIQTKYFELEKIFQIKIFKNSIFLSWISYLFIEQIDQFIQKTNSFLHKFQLISLFGPIWKNKIKIKIQNTGKFLSLKYHDFLMGKWYQKKIHTWFYKVLIKTKRTKINQSFNKNLNFSHSSDMIEIYNRAIYYPQNEICSKVQTLKKKKFFAKEEKVNKWSFERSNKILENNSIRLQKTNKSKQRYLKLLKKILLKNKVTTQIEVIQQLNQIIGNWDTYAINNITKKKALKLNLLIYQLLWFWGFARHRQQKAKWIKNRYWFFRPLC